MLDGSGYLVVYSQNQKRIATMYDEYLNFIADIDPEAEEVITQMNTADEVEGLDSMWEEVLGELTPEEREHALVFHLQGEPDADITDDDTQENE